jgi:hypothetical protein
LHRRALESWRLLIECLSQIFVVIAHDSTSSLCRLGITVNDLPAKHRPEDLS